jgi:riboflavin-specific deaminase-like protein
MRERPFITANFAITADGRISTRKLTPSDFSSPRDKRRLLEIRAECDAVLASAKTIAADHMTMGLPAEDLRTARATRKKPPYPLRVLISNRGRIDSQLRVFQKDFSPIVIFSTEQMPAANRRALAARAALHLSPGKVVDLPEMMHLLRRKYGVRRLVCEGGAQVFRSLLEADLIDELYLTLCPRIFGGVKAPTLSGVAASFLPRSTRLRLKSMTVVDGECFLRYSLRHGFQPALNS